MEIETKTASLETFSVTIKTLHVNNKQMTLAVFRQLEEIGAYNEDGTLRDFEYWGYVKYKAKGSDGAQYWAVLSNKGMLFISEIQSKNYLASRKRELVSKRETYKKGLSELIQYKESMIEWNKKKIEHDERIELYMSKRDKAEAEYKLIKPDPFSDLSLFVRIADEDVKKWGKDKEQYIKERCGEPPEMIPWEQPSLSRETRKMGEQDDIEGYLSELNESITSIDNAIKSTEFLMRKPQLFIAV